MFYAFLIGFSVYVVWRFFRRIGFLPAVFLVLGALALTGAWYTALFPDTQGLLPTILLLAGLALMGISAVCRRSVWTDVYPAKPLPRRRAGPVAWRDVRPPGPDTAADRYRFARGRRA